jgi:hypothetical protein
MPALPPSSASTPVHPRHLVHVRVHHLLLFAPDPHPDPDSHARPWVVLLGVVVAQGEVVSVGVMVVVHVRLRRTPVPHETRVVGVEVVGQHLTTLGDIHEEMRRRGRGLICTPRAVTPHPRIDPTPTRR